MRMRYCGPVKAFVRVNLTFIMKNKIRFTAPALQRLTTFSYLGVGEGDRGWK